MKIVDLRPEYEKTYLMCFEDWSEEMKEAGDHKCQWYQKMKDNGLGVKIALNDNGEAYGMIQYVPIEYSTANGHNLYFIDCIWVHGYKEGVGNHQKRGTGIELLKAAEEDVLSRGADGIVAWGMALPFWMKGSWYKKQGYIKTDKMGISVLLWKPFKDGAQRPHWIKEVKQPKKQANPGKVTVVAFYNGRCQVPLIMLERARRAAASFGDRVIFETINTFDRSTFLEWGISDGLYIEGKKIYNGPPLKYDKIVTAIAKNIKRLKEEKRR